MNYKLLILALFLALSSCSNKITIEDEYVFENQNWHRFNDLEFDFKIQSTEEPYKIYLIFEFNEDLKSETFRFQTQINSSDGDSRLSFIEEKINKSSTSDTVIINPHRFFNTADNYKLIIKNLSHKVDNHGFKSVKLKIEQL